VYAVFFQKALNISRREVLNTFLKQTNDVGAQVRVVTGRGKAHSKLWSTNSPRIVSEAY